MDDVVREADATKGTSTSRKAKSSVGAPMIENCEEMCRENARFEHLPKDLVGGKERVNELSNRIVSEEPCKPTSEYPWDIYRTVKGLEMRRDVMLHDNRVRRNKS